MSPIELLKYTQDPVIWKTVVVVTGHQDDDDDDDDVLETFGLSCGKT